MGSRLSFAGSGRITAAHGLAAESLPGVDVVAVASRDPAHARERAGQMGALECTYEELPAGADVVVVATPPSRHRADVLHALGRGAAVIVEKPLCTTLADADAIVAAAGPAGERVGYAENLAFAPVVVRAVEIASGLGPLRHLEVRALSPRPDWGDFLQARWGGGVLFDLGVHPLAIAMMLAVANGQGSAGAGREALHKTADIARVISVRARIEGADDIEVDDHAEVDIQFDTGLVARVEASWRNVEPQWDLQAASDTGVVRAELQPHLVVEHNGEELALDAVATSVAVPQVEQFGYRSQMASFLADFAAGTAPGVNATFGRAILEVVCAAYTSAAGHGRAVALPFDGPRDLTPLQMWRPLGGC